MRRDNEYLESAIWLLADSPPSKHERYLDEPLDWRFPTRHNIWTPIGSVINRELFRHQRSRIDDRKFYVRNAVDSPETWNDENKLNDEILKFGRMLAEPKPPFLILTFGRNSFEFARRSQNEGKRLLSHWTVERLSKEFADRSHKVEKGEGNLLPLLHISIARQYECCHTRFSGDLKNYYEYVGGKLAKILIEHRENARLRDLWM